MDKSEGDLAWVRGHGESCLASQHPRTSFPRPSLPPRRPPLGSPRAGWPWPHPEVGLPATAAAPAFSRALLRTRKRTRPGQECSS